MGFGAIICFLIAAFAIETGEVFMIVIFGGLGIWLTYLWATKDERRKKDAEERRKREEAALRNRAQARFSNSSFVSLVLRDLQRRNWVDLENGNSCQILKDKIVTAYRTYTYIDYNLQKLDAAGCQELATYLGSFYPGDYSISKIEHFVGGLSSSYSGYVSSNGSVSICRDADGHDVVDGYRLHKKAPAKPQAPQGQKW